MTGLNDLELLNPRLHSVSHQKPQPQRKLKKHTDYTPTGLVTSVGETNFDLTLLRGILTSGKVI
jgi:hypothetical protein